MCVARQAKVGTSEWVDRCVCCSAALCVLLCCPVLAAYPSQYLPVINTPSFILIHAHKERLNLIVRDILLLIAVDRILTCMWQRGREQR